MPKRVMLPRSNRIAWIIRAMAIPVAIGVILVVEPISTALAVGLVFVATVATEATAVIVSRRIDRRTLDRAIQRFKEEERSRTRPPNF